MDAVQDNDVTILILLGTVGILVLIGGMIMFILIYQKRILLEKQKQATQELEYQNRMIRLQFESQEQERTRIGADLHDSLGSLLWGAKVNASFIQRSVELSESAQTSYHELNQILDESIDVVRRIAWELTPEAFQDAGLSESVRKLCERLDGKGIGISMADSGEMFWNDGRALQVFRIIQELVSNAIKHSEATKMTISLQWQPQLLRVRVLDNGVGFSDDIAKKGVGLWNIRHRIKQLNGRISIGIPPTGPGTDISLEIPLQS